MHNTDFHRDMRAMFERLRRELSDACRMCDHPRVPCDQMNFDKPETCICHCHKTDGLRRAVIAMEQDLDLGQTA